MDRVVIPILVLFGGLLLTGAIIAAVGIRRAPEGWETESGFETVDTGGKE